MLNLGKILKLGKIAIMQKSPRVQENPGSACGRFHDSLEALQLSPHMEMSNLQVLEKLPVAARKHTGACKECLAAVDDFVALRGLLLPLASEFSSPSPSPWFPSKVMNAISAQEADMDRGEAVWLSVRNLAPRLAAFSALLLVLAGTWAFQVQQRVQAAQMTRPTESLYEPTPPAPINDDILTTAGGIR